MNEATMTPEDRAQDIMDSMSFEGDFYNWDEIANMIATAIRDARKQ